MNEKRFPYLFLRMSIIESKDFLIFILPWIFTNYGLTLIGVVVNNNIIIRKPSVFYLWDICTP